MIRSTIKKIFPAFVIEIVRSLINQHAWRSYSQEGEDMILKRVFEKKHTGFYVDVGAHHPMRFSNTYFFYKKGWRGINVDAMPGSMALFRIFRRRDVNLEIPISAEGKILTYYVFNEPALNGFDVDLSAARNLNSNQYKILGTIDLPTRRLDSVLNEHLPTGQEIDFLSIDVEGLDLEVLKSNDWTKYKPDVILVEVLGSTLADIEGNEITGFLDSHGYKIYAKTVNTVIYKSTY